MKPHNRITQAKAKHCCLTRGCKRTKHTTCMTDYCNKPVKMKWSATALLVIDAEYTTSLREQLALNCMHNGFTSPSDFKEHTSRELHNKRKQELHSLFPLLTVCLDTTLMWACQKASTVANPQIESNPILSLSRGKNSPLFSQLW